MAYGIDYVNNFTGGENNWASPDNLLDGELLLCKNAELMGRGGFKKRPGVSVCTDFRLPTDEGRGEILHVFEFLGSLVAICAYEYYVKIRARPFSNINTFGAVTEIYAYPFSEYLSNSAVITYEIYKNKVYILGRQKFLVFDGTTVAEVTCAEADSNLSVIMSGNNIEQRGERLFCSVGSNLYFSEPGRPEYWKTLNVLNVVSDDTESITALQEYNGALIVFKPSSVFAWEGYNPETEVEFFRLNTHTGTRYRETIQKVGNTLLYLGEDGVYALQGVEKNLIVSTKISNNVNNRLYKDLAAIKAPYNGMAPEEGMREGPYVLFSAPCAVYSNGKYMITINDTTYVYFYDIVSNTQNMTESWGIYTFSSELDTHVSKLFFENRYFNYTYKFAPWSYLTVNNNLLFTHSDAVYMFIDTSVSDSTAYKDSAYTSLTTITEAPIQLHVKLKPLAQNDYIRNKKYKNGYLVMQQYSDKNSSCTINVYVDYAESAVAISPDDSCIYDLDTRYFDSQVWDFTDLITKKFSIKATGKRILLDISDDTIGNTITVYGAGVEYKVKKPDRG